MSKDSDLSPSKKKRKTNHDMCNALLKLFDRRVDSLLGENRRLKTTINDLRVENKNDKDEINILKHANKTSELTIKSLSNSHSLLFQQNMHLYQIILNPPCNYNPFILQYFPALTSGYPGYMLQNPNLAGSLHRTLDANSVIKACELNNVLKGCRFENTYNPLENIEMSFIGVKESRKQFDYTNFYTAAKDVLKLSSSSLNLNCSSKDLFISYVNYHLGCNVTAGIIGGDNSVHGVVLSKELLGINLKIEERTEQTYNYLTIKPREKVRYITDKFMFHKKNSSEYGFNKTSVECSKNIANIPNFKIPLDKRFETIKDVLDTFKNINLDMQNYVVMENRQQVGTSMSSSSISNRVSDELHRAS